MTRPTRCLIAEPHPHSVDFGGEFINLKRLAQAAGVHHTHLSRVFGGLRPIPKLEYCRLLADALGMELLDFIEALEDRASREMDKRITRRREMREREDARRESRQHAHA